MQATAGGPCMSEAINNKRTLTFAIMVFEEENQKGGVLMSNNNNNIEKLPTIQEIESSLFRGLQDIFQDTLLSILEELDEQLMHHRDFGRFKNREKQSTTLATMFGHVTINR